MGPRLPAPALSFERAYDSELEQVLLPARWLTIGLITLGLLFSVRAAAWVWSLVAVAVAYNLVVQMAVANGKLHRFYRQLDPAVHSLLTVVGLIGTGGLDSIFLPLLPVQLAAVCMLAPSRRAVPMGSGMALGFAAACLIKYPATTDPSRLALFTGFSLALVWMVAALARTASAQRQRFIQVAAHELRTPMTAIKAICALVSGQVAAGREIPDNLLPLLSQEVERLSSLLTEATAVFGLQAGRLDAELIPLDLKKVAGAAVAVATTIDPRHTYVLETGPAPLAVMGNSRCLEAVFGNLLDNAAKYSPPDTTISIALTDAGGWARAAIADQGEGIPATELRRVFEPFYRLDRPQAKDPGGMGLGLYIAGQLLEREQGRIWAESEPGHGAKFVVELPLHPTAELAV